MKRLICISVCGFCLSSLLAAQEQIPPAKKSAPAQAPQSQKERAGYAIGVDVGRMLKSRSFDEIDLAFLARGIRDAISGATPAMTDEECQQTIETFQKEAQTRAAAKNKTEGERFLAANAKKQGVKTTKSGLQYKVLTEGTGPSPKPTDVVRTHYHGTFISGEVFDSSVERKEPAEFPVGNVIPGWTEALQMMKVGSKWQLVVPSDLAYGVRGRPGIPPNATLIFEVELLGIVKPKPSSE